MREYCTSGSARGAARKGSPYRGDRIAVFLSQSLELPVAHLAAFRAGLVSIPLFLLMGEFATKGGMNASLFRAAPYIVFGCMVLACAIIPTLSTDLPLASAADAIALSIFRG